MSRAKESPVIVVGAGVIGLFTAINLRALTSRQIIILEAGEIGGGTTPAGAGFVAPWATVLPHLGRAGLQLVEHSLDQYRAIAATGADIHFRANGNIVFYNSDETLRAGLDAVAANPQRSDDTSVLTAKDIAKLTSGAVDPAHIAGGLLMPRGIQFETNLLLDHLTSLAVEAGIELLPHHEVVSIERDAGRLVGLHARVATSSRSGSGPGWTIETDTVVLAAGAWLNQLLDHVGWRLPLLPFVATRFVTADVGLDETMPTMQGKDFPLWIRESEGGFTWGTTPGAAPAHRLADAWRAYDASERQRDDLIEAMTADASRVAQVFPALVDAEVIRTVQGMPVYTVDGMFFAGAVPGCAGLWAVGGDNEAGVSHAPGLGLLMAQLVTHAASYVCDPTPYRLDRFEPDAFPDPEAVGQHYVEKGVGFIADTMKRPAVSH